MDLHWYIDSKSFISLTLFIMALVLTSYLVRIKEKNASDRWMVAGMVSQCFFMATTSVMVSMGFWGTVFFGPQFIFAMITYTCLVLFAYHYPQNDKPAKARLILSVSLLFTCITVVLSAIHIYLFLQTPFQSSTILSISFSLQILLFLALLMGIVIFLRQSVHRSKTALTNSDILQKRLSAFFLLQHPQTREARALRNMSMAFFFGFLPGIAQPLISAELISGVAGFYIYSLGLIVELMAIFMIYVDHTQRTFSFIYKLVCYSLGILLVVMGGAAWLNAENLYKLIAENIETNLSRVNFMVTSGSLEQLPAGVAYVVSWSEEDELAFTSYKTVYADSNSFTSSFIIRENRLRQRNPELLEPYPQSSDVDTLERLRAISADNVVRFDDNPIGSTPRYIGYQFSYDGRRYETGYSMDYILKTIHENILPMLYLVIICSLIVWYVLPLVLRSLLVQPLERLLAGVERFQEYGTERLPIKVQHEDEIGYLTHAFNLMMQTLKASEMALLRANSELEERVAARTSELSQSNIQLKNEIVERKRIEKELIVARDKAEAATQAKSEFLAMMSHEIRTPLNAIIGMTSLLLITPHSSEQKEYIETIRISGENLLTIINHVLDFSKIESGGMDLEQQSFELIGCIEEVLDLVAVYTPLDRIELLYTIAPDVPPVIYGDITRLRQVLVNLVGNAVKFTDAGDVLISVKRVSQAQAAAVPEGEIAGGVITLAFSVSDTGIGISENHMPRLFKPFSQADASTTRKYGGTGLGLAISDRLVQMMGGRLSVESEEGKGSTFYFTIKTKAAVLEEQEYTMHDGRYLQGKRILIIDDNPSSCNVLEDLCRRWQMAALSVTSGGSALELLKLDKNFDAALVDRILPDMDGFELAGRISGMKGASHIPLVLLNASNKLRKPDGKKQKDVFSAYLAKPIKISPLFTVLNNILSDRLYTTNDKKGSDSIMVDKDFARRLPLHILVAEDNTVNQRLALRVFEKMGYRIDIVSNGLEVLESAERHRYDVIFMDVQMPEMDGLEASRRLQSKKDAAQRPRIIAMTADALEGDREKCLQAGMDDYISKPVRISDIQRALERWGKPSDVS